MHWYPFWNEKLLKYRFYGSIRVFLKVTETLNPVLSCIYTDLVSSNPDRGLPLSPMISNVDRTQGLEADRNLLCLEFGGRFNAALKKNFQMRSIFHFQT